jgi:hypothetical protein
MVAIALLMLVLIGVSNPHYPIAPSAVVAAPVTEPRTGAAPDPEFIPILAAARHEAVALGQKRLNELIRSFSKRVESAFVPHYLSFGRRKLEEIRAYNAFAWDRIKAVFGHPVQDSSIPLLVTTFDKDFSGMVTMPAASRRSLHDIGNEVAQRYADLVMIGLQTLQTAKKLSFVKWQDYLDGTAPGNLRLAGQSPIKVTLAELAVPDPLRNRLSQAMGAALEARFAAYPSITTNRQALRTPDGRSIFDVGSNVWAYYGSYIVYWIILVTLIRSGYIPLSLFGALIGWLIWETFVWSTWIGYEWMGFEQTKAALEPVILQQADAYLEGLRSLLADSGYQGPFQVLWDLEQAWQPD